MKRMLLVFTLLIAGVMHAPALALPTFNDVKAA